MSLFKRLYLKILKLNCHSDANTGGNFKDGKDARREKRKQRK